MKKLQILLVMLMLPMLTWAQSKVNASEIIAKINRGEAVSYKNAEIVGDLDLTKLQNMKQKEQKGDHSTKEYISTVTAPLSFVNCTFKGDVLAYFNPDNGVNMVNTRNEVYNTNFEQEVRFDGCVFEEASAFKYSEFNEGASFISTRFSEEALFKYSKFRKLANFSSATFRGDANFKYVTFPVKVSFTGATFGSEANFKYTKFEEGVNFQKATFDGTANFKYAKITDSFNIKGANFRGGDDFKYTKLNNRQVSLTTLLEMNRQ
ncbi:pentapeptide repeat-containing protein [Pontibacter cellulosilyticus]|uniref:Pentapeptide repeat-containing protein n=1 Tax=Pontibacter cellulosilyticus TaxID=1720253 RepID=A0A923SLF5_9BACT|nr:pentapeptide repeat-containing protein [Pontibacter cellulosilyticus]MBC5994826.1 pentapeptide repeat-containing protein [Pontibacter cellulosilyticus]